MTVKRGDVVWVDWPFSDRTGSKVRPAVVIQDDRFNLLIADSVLLLVSRTQRAIGETEVEIDPRLEPQSGLRFRCVVSCTNYLTIDQGLIGRVIGRLSNATLLKIEACIKKALRLH